MKRPSTHGQLHHSHPVWSLPFTAAFLGTCLFLVQGLLTSPTSAAEPKPDSVHRLLYVATPGIRNYLQYGGHGLIVFDIDNQHKFVKRIPTGGLDEKGKPINVKGVCVSIPLQRIYISTLHTLMCVDLITEKLIWEKSYPGGCDRMSVTPDGQTIYLPSLEKDHWHVVNAEDGRVVAKITPKSGAHNTIVGLNGREAYLAGLRSPLLTISDTSSPTTTRTVGPFSAPVRPFTVNGSQTLCYVNINGLLGFEIGNIKTGKKLYRVEVEGFSMGPVKRHGCPSHGIGLTPDEKEIWVSDGHNGRMQIFDNTVMPPQQVTSIALRDQPGWITFSLDGKYAWPSSGEVIEVASRKTVALLTDEKGRDVGSEKIVEIHFQNNRPVRAGDQFGLGRKME